MVTFVLWQSVYPESCSPARSADLFRQLVGIYLLHKLDGPLSDQVQETLANSDQDGPAVLEELAARFLQHAQLLSVVAGIAEDRGWYEEAAFYLRQAISLRPQTTSYRYRLGRILGLRLGEATAGAAELLAAVDHAPRPSRDMLVDLATVQLAAGDLAGAIETATLHRGIDPDEPFAAAVLAACAAREGDLEAEARYLVEAGELLSMATDLDIDEVERIETLLESIEHTPTIRRAS
jgi:tetratricopeptide (TPR) repeat protein